MTNKQLNQVNEVIDYEGFEYTFIDHSNFEEIDDDQFHELRLKYEEAHNALYEYLRVDEYNECEGFEVDGEEDDESE